MNSNDELVLRTIQVIQSYDEERFKPKDKTISSFLKGAVSSPFYSYYVSHPDLCGAVRMTVKEVNHACARLINDEKIEIIHSDGLPYYKAIVAPLFLSTCNNDELEYIESVGKYILNTYTYMQCTEKVNRITYQNPNILGENSILFSHMWFTKQNGQLVFRYKKFQNDSEKSLYKDNTIIANKLQKKTIINVIDFLLG